MGESSGHALEDLVEPVNHYIQDPFAKRIVGFLKNTPITPNQVTYFSVLVGFASGYAFSFASPVSLVLGGILLEITLVLDCVDGQLARAKGMASEWGRLIDGIAGYFAYLAVVYGLIIGFPEHGQVLKIIAGLIIIRAISYDYCKQSLATLILKGYDGMEREIQDTCEKLRTQKSSVLVLYFYYLQAQQLFFRGKWSFLHRVKKGSRELQPDLTFEQRKACHEKIKTLLVFWRWNGLDLPLFLLALFAVLGILPTSLTPFAYIMTAQVFMTLLAHHYFARRI
ncbi:MAG: CDP-alcohol phosphatidyltransferase family protein [Nitrospina sp.]|jgi:phosphatidylglycerophosphate synthase|nr:CDP-alcohol phosphatidyltransferase family protein [Nitrospina sp.]